MVTNPQSMRWRISKLYALVHIYHQPPLQFSSQRLRRWMIHQRYPDTPNNGSNRQNGASINRITVPRAHNSLSLLRVWRQCIDLSHTYIYSPYLLYIVLGAASIYILSYQLTDIAFFFKVIQYTSQISILNKMAEISLGYALISLLYYFRLSLKAYQFFLIKAFNLIKNSLIGLKFNKYNSKYISLIPIYNTSACYGASVISVTVTKGGHPSGGGLYGTSETMERGVAELRS